MMNIDIERLIDAVAACNEAYNEYCRSAKTFIRDLLRPSQRERIM